MIAMIKQKEYCNKNDYPMFVADSGICYSCNRSIQDNGEELITGCPHCNRSFCD